MKSKRNKFLRSSLEEGKRKQKELRADSARMKIVLQYYSLCASHLRPMLLFFKLLSEAFLLESVSEQQQCSLSLLFFLICQVRSVLIQACRRLFFLQSFLKRISLMPSTSFTHTQSHLPAQFPLSSTNQSQCEKCHVLV